MINSKEETFIAKFHALAGITLAERKKNLFLLFNETQQSLNHSAITFDLSSLRPKTPLEEAFRIEALIYFKNTPKLLEELKNENPIIIHKILNANSAFIQEIFNIDGKQLILEFFPHFSYNTKLKVLNKLAKHVEDTNKMDDLFYSVKDSYGLYLASKVISGCSSTLIMKYLKAYNIEVTPKQLLTIIKRYPTLTYEIIEILHKKNKKQNIADKYRCVLVYLIQYDQATFLKVTDKYKPDFYKTIGTRLTRKLIKSCQDHIIKNLKHYYRLLKMTNIYRYIKPNFEEFVCNLLPNSVEQIEFRFSEYQSIFNLLSSDENKWKLLQTTFKKKYNCELFDHPICMTQNIMEMIYPNDVRVTWLKSQIRPQEMAEEMWIAFRKIEESIPLLKHRISLTSNIREREMLIKSLVFTCKFNRDKTALAEVCEYVVTKHRNDHLNIRQEFLTAIYDSYKLQKLQLIHWKPIIELIRIFAYNKDYCWKMVSFIDAYINFCLNANMPIEENLKLRVEIEPYNFNICKSTPRYEKKCLEMFYDIIILKLGDDEMEYSFENYSRCVNDWNKRNPRNKICTSIYKSAMDIIKSKLEKSSSYMFNNITTNYIISNFKDLENHDLLEILIKNVTDADYYHLKLINWLIKNQPMIYLQYLDNLIDILFKLRMSMEGFSSLIRYYSHINIPQKMETICLKTINNEDETSEKKHRAIFILSKVMKPNEFINFISPYYPTDSVIDPENSEMTNSYKIQQSISCNLKNLIPPFNALEPILNFCKGDYLKFVQKSLYLICQNVAENRLDPFLDILIARAVSVRKHAIFLAVKTLDKTNVFNRIENYMNTEKNVSIRKNIFKSIFNLFSRNPDDYTWNLVKVSIKAVDPNDKEAFSKLAQTKRIPLEYCLQYITFVWEALNNLSITDKIEIEKCNVLRLIDEDNISKLANNFCIEIIEKYLFKSKQLTELQKEIHILTSKYLIYCTSQIEQKQRIKHVLSIIKNNINSNMEIFTFNLVQTFCSNFIEKREIDKNALYLFVEYWNNLFQPYDAFNEYLYLHFTLIFVECKDDKERLNLVAKKLFLLCEALEKSHCLDLYIFSQTFDTFKIALDDTVSENEKENEMNLLEAIIKKSNDRISSSLVLYLLPVDPYDKLKYNSIIEIIRKQPDKSVQMHLRHYLINKK